MQEPDRVSPYFHHVTVFNVYPSDRVLNTFDPFQSARKSSLKLSPSKAITGAMEAGFLGHTVSPAGVKPRAD